VVCPRAGAGEDTCRVSHSILLFANGVVQIWSLASSAGADAASHVKGELRVPTCVLLAWRARRAARLVSLMGGTSRTVGYRRCAERGTFFHKRLRLRTHWVRSSPVRVPQASMPAKQ